MSDEVKIESDGSCDELDRILNDKELKGRIRRVKIFSQTRWGFWLFLIAVAICIAAANIAESYFKYKGAK